MISFGIHLYFQAEPATQPLAKMDGGQNHPFLGGITITITTYGHLSRKKINIWY
jgi:hypothetical protein